MPQPTTTLRTPQPCAESWDAMTPAAAGRHCATCQKTVLDFTQKTDTEILAALRQAAGETCGRLRADQVSRPLVVPTAAPRWRIWLGTVLALGGIFGATRATAQVRANYYAGPQPLASPKDNTAPEPVRSPATAPVGPLAAPNGLVTLRGTISDSATQEKLSGVTVLVKGSTTGTLTDANGGFTLSVPAGQAVRLIVSFIGFVSQERLVATPGTQPLAFALAADTRVLLGEVIVTDYKRPSPPRRLFNWGKYWLTKPFRN